jgi:hypothetical protein
MNKHKIIHAVNVLIILLLLLLLFYRKTGRYEAPELVPPESIFLDVPSGAREPEML